jgi:hypothetical protein
VNWFSEDVVSGKWQEIQKLLLILLENINVNIKSLKEPKRLFTCKHSESETEGRSTVRLVAELLFKILCNCTNIQTTCSYAQGSMGSLIYPSVMDKR